MTLQDVKLGNSSRAAQVTIMCLERGISNREIVSEYIEKANLNHSKEFPDKKPANSSRNGSVNDALQAAVFFAFA
jgi:hypothetical protein